MSQKCLSCVKFYRFPEFIDKWGADASDSADHGSKAERISADLSREKLRSVNPNDGERAGNAKLGSEHQPPGNLLNRE